MDLLRFARQVDITKRAASLVYQAVQEQGVLSMARLCEISGLGEKSVERLYAHFRMTPVAVRPDPTLFDGLET